MLSPIPPDEFPAARVSSLPESEVPEPPLPVHGSASREEMETCLSCPLEECTPLPVEMTKASINAVVRAMDQAVFHLDPYGLALTARSGDSAKARRTAAGEPAEDWEYE